MAVFNDIWLVGDDFLREIKDALFALQRRSKVKSQDPLFIFQMFNIKYEYVSLHSLGLVWILNALIKLLNDNDRLPKYLLVIPDKDLLVKLKTSNFASVLVMGSSIHFLIKQLDLMVDRRKNDLIHKKPGAWAEEHPTVIWIHMLK